MRTLHPATRIMKSHVTDLLARVEDGRKTRRLIVEEMRQNIRSVKSLVANAIADLKRMERWIDENEVEVRKWEERAGLALKKGEEDLARRALVRKSEHIQQANQYRDQVGTQQEAIGSLRERLKTLEAKLNTMGYSEAKRAAVGEEHSQSRVTPSTSADLVIDMSAFDAYDRMVEVVQNLEAQVAALTELIQGGDLEGQFHELERQDQIEKDLAALKAKVAAEHREGSSTME